MHSKENEQIGTVNNALQKKSEELQAPQKENEQIRTVNNDLQRKSKEVQAPQKENEQIGTLNNALQKKSEELQAPQKENEQIRTVNNDLQRKSKEVQAPQKENEQISTVNNELLKQPPKSTKSLKFKLKIPSKGSSSGIGVRGREPFKEVEAPQPEKGQLLAMNNKLQPENLKLPESSIKPRKEKKPSTDAENKQPEKGQLLAMNNKLQPENLKLPESSIKPRKEKKAWTDAENKALIDAVKSNPQITVPQLQLLPELRDRGYESIKTKLYTYKTKGIKGKQKMTLWEELMTDHVLPALKQSEKNMMEYNYKMVREVVAEQLSSENFKKQISMSMIEALRKNEKKGEMEK